MNVQSHEFFPLVKMKRKIQQTMEQAYTVRDWLNRVGGWVVRRQAVGRGSGAMGYGSWVVGRICLKLKKDINIYMLLQCSVQICKYPLTN